VTPLPSPVMICARPFAEIPGLLTSFSWTAKPHAVVDRDVPHPRACFQRPDVEALTVVAIPHGREMREPILTGRSYDALPR
jgi:hypothetical protein